MKNVLKKQLNQLLSLFKGHATVETSQDRVKNLMKSLRPIKTSCGLIRLGPDGDGGYLIPDDLEGIEACFSPGVSDISGFELDCAKRGMNVFLADRSVDNPAEDHPQFSFIKKYIGVTNNEDFISLDRWVKGSEVSSDGDLLLQMDIEGYEYEVLLSTPEELMKRFKIIVVEFHLLEELFNRPFFNLASRAFDKLLETHHCVHIHPNNYCDTIKKSDLVIPKLMEFTFYRKDEESVEKVDYSKVFPHSLDSDNTSRPSLALPGCWY